MSSIGDGPDPPGKAESGSSPIFPTALTSPVNWLTLRKLLSVGEHHQLRSGRSGVLQQTDGNKVYSLVRIDLLKLCLVYPFCPLTLSSSFNPPVNPQQLLSSNKFFLHHFTSFLLTYEHGYNPSVVSLLITSNCLSVFCLPLVYITLTSLPLLLLECVCVSVGSVSAYFAYYFVKVIGMVVWMEAVTMVAFQVNKQQWRVCLNVHDCPVLTEAECTFGLSVWPFHYLLPINLPMQAHTEASQCLFMLNGRFYGCRDVLGCLLTRTVRVFVRSICNLKRMWIKQI